MDIVKKKQPGTPYIKWLAEPIGYSVRAINLQLTIIRQVMATQYWSARIFHVMN